MDEPKPLPRTQEEAELEAQKMRDDALVARWQHYHDLAYRMLVGDGTAAQSCFDPVEVRHFAEMLLLLDIARSGSGFTRFTSRYAGNY
jgi:hypothetical protein